MSCTVARRRRLAGVAHALAPDRRVRGTTVQAPGEGPGSGWALRVTLAGQSVPPRVLRELVLADLSITAVTPQGPDYCILMAQP